ncbi:hypothetical protein FisN_2Hu044 [Fistulifera solaris]|uniref:Uncharacterized protein n=1 Tax=Fistulifera solaris TaxID=1519565 RepID=A0A1Z5KE19_FISSO|nr:hypothetical protein FisN_2Hu044 [Fistulifera solaris]|eukprot:GAX24467.1 hypothetical protein FisN_2Hu044 [Fistulifera solaris]
MLRIISSKANTLQEAMDEIHREVEELVGENRQRTHESTLIVFDDRQEMALHFVHFTDLLKEARGNYRDLVDLIPFHPRNKHANLKGKDVPNEEPFDYSFRSPFPTIHLLREEDIMKSERAGDTDYIRRRNRDRFHRQGLDVCRERLQACYDVEK